MITSSRVSKHWVEGGMWRVIQNGRRFGKPGDTVYRFDTGQVFGADHALGLCRLGSVVGWVHRVGWVHSYERWDSFIVCTDEPERVQIAVDEGYTEFYIAES